MHAPVRPAPLSPPGNRGLSSIFTLCNMVLPKTGFLYWARGCCTQTGVRTVPHPSRRSASTRSPVPLASEQTIGRLCNLLLPITGYAETPYYDDPEIRGRAPARGESWIPPLGPEREDGPLVPLA